MTFTNKIDTVITGNSDSVKMADVLGQLFIANDRQVYNDIIDIMACNETAEMAFDMAFESKAI